MAALSRPRKAVEDFLACGERLVELIDGEIYDRVPTDDVHQRAVLRLTCRLFDPSEDPRFGRIVMSPFDVYLPSGDIVVPDLLFVVPERLGIIHNDGVHGVPDLLVEIVRAGHAERDRIVKRDLTGCVSPPAYRALDCSWVAHALVPDTVR